MLMEGLRLLGLGMTMVFLYLALLVLVITGTAWFFRSFARYFPDPGPEDAAGLGVPPAPGGDDRARLAAALAAIEAHRAKGRQR
jgi:sodium pump decarboxylase gamma subunit